MVQSCAYERGDSLPNSIEHWLGQLPSQSSAWLFTPRKRSASCCEPTCFGATKSESAYKRRRPLPSPQSHSPRKRSRAEADEPPLEQSASVSSITELTAQTRLPYGTRSNPSTSSRPNSPVRDIFNELRMSIPPVLYEPPGGTRMPDAAIALRKSLTEGFGERVVPIGLKVFVFSYGMLKAANNALD